MTLIDDCDDEIHEYYISNNQHYEPKNPSQDFEVSTVCNKRSHVKISDRRSQHHEKEIELVDTIIYIIRLVIFWGNKNNLRNQGHGAYHNQEEDQK
jgi:hypothetical protein